MGIDDLNGFLRSKCPSVFIKRRLTEFSGKRVAFDANNWMFRMMTIAHKKVVDATDVCLSDPDREEIVRVWLNSMLDSICTFLSYGITPVFIFDGAHPAKKAKTKEERKRIKDDIRTRIVQMKEEIEATDILLRSSKMVEDLRKLMRQIFYVTKVEEEAFRSVLVGVGLPCVQATGEAEQLCTMLCKDGKVTAVYSADTDNLAYGCPFLIEETLHEYEYDPVDKSRYHLVMTVKIDDILRGLEVTYEQFVDLCILMGCDYNESIPQVGGTRAYNLIKKFGSIDDFPRLMSSPNLICRDACGCGLPRTYRGVELKYDTNVLDYHFCRKQFSAATSTSLRNGNSGQNGTPERHQVPSSLDPTVTEEPPLSLRDLSENNSLDVNKRALAESARDVLESYRLDRVLNRFIDLYKQLPIPQDTVVPATTSPSRAPVGPTLSIVREEPVSSSPKPKMVLVLQ